MFACVLIETAGSGRINPVVQPVEWFARAFMDQKMLFERASVIDSDAIHVLVGVGLQLVAALVLRRSLASVWPWLIVFALELANEVNDVVQQVWPDPAMQLGEGVKDVVVTMALPTLLLLIARFAPSVLTGKPNKEPPLAVAEADEKEWLPELDSNQRPSD